MYLAANKVSAFGLDIVAISNIWGGVGVGVGNVSSRKDERK